jgi:hypothetical protein
VASLLKDHGFAAYADEVQDAVRALLKINTLD